MTGTLRIVGVGPGDPELVTVKAARLLAAARVVAFFAAKRGGDGHARRIAASFLPGGVEDIRLEYPVTTEFTPHDPRYRALIDAFHDAAADALAARLAAGTDLVLLCEGDPFFYGSSMHLHDRLRSRFAVEVVPGITAMSGAWSGAGRPIAHGDDVLSVIPGTLPDERLRAVLRASEASVVMKLGRNLPRVRAALAEADRLAEALYVEHATAPAAHATPLCGRDPGAPAPYFSLLLVPGRKHAR